MNLWFATNNTHKKHELESCLKEAVPNVKLMIPSEEGISFDPAETGTAFFENALIKARALKELLGNDDPVIADDSGLCVDSLDGRPGVYSSHYGFTDKKKLTSREQNILLLEELSSNPKRTARFICAMVLLFSNDRFYFVQETLEGEIARKSDMRGEGGFGYDPVFLVSGFGRTLAELSTEEKNSLSHRGKAGRLIAKMLWQN
ncbi:MAG: RdgB/HAM1 family non-canonical purine NTP pyrophosphatase [Treponema sp.]|nr:RdgB/HAM1 family non-canonical purine NTP pyrophosphatase [Treponema sp.]